MNELVTFTYPQGRRRITVSISPDGAVSVEVRRRTGPLLSRADGEVTPERAQRVIHDLVIASKLGLPADVEIHVGLYDSTPDPGLGETRSSSPLETARELGREILQRYGVHPGRPPYGPLAFVKWTFAFALILVLAAAIGEYVANSQNDSILYSVVLTKGKNGGGGLLVMGLLVLFGFGVVTDRFADAHGGSARPIWPALFATAPFMYIAHGLGEWLGVVYLSAYMVLPLLLVAFGVQILNPTGLSDRGKQWFNWRGWY